MPNITGLEAPVIGDDKFDYADKITDSFTALDNHDHSSGKGLPVPTGGLSDLAVTEPKIANLAVALTKMKAMSAGTGQGQVATSASPGTATSTGTESSETAQVTLNCVANRPVLIFCQGAPGSDSYIEAGGSSSATVRLKANGVTVSRFLTAGSVAEMGFPPFVYLPSSSGNVTFGLTIQRVSGAVTSTISNMSLIAVQL